MSGKQSLAAIVLAAGYSSRAPDFKPLLPLGDSTVIEHAVNCFRLAGIFDITVVAGHRADELIPALDRLQVRHVLNDTITRGCFPQSLAVYAR